MKYLTIALFILMTGTVCSATETEADYFVSTRGSDSWSGTLAEPNAQGNDGPFVTLERARDAVRDLKKKKTSDIVVLVREGTYQLKNTVVFGLEDSPQDDATVTYAAYPDETPVFSSGREIKDWVKATGELPGLPKEAWGKVWMADVPDRFFTLYDAEGMLPRASSAGFIPLSGSSRNQLHFPKGKLKNWPNVEDAEIIVRPHHAWISNVLHAHSLAVDPLFVERGLIMQRLLFCFQSAAPAAAEEFTQTVGSMPRNTGLHPNEIPTKNDRTTNSGHTERFVFRICDSR